MTGFRFRIRKAVVRRTLPLISAAVLLAALAGCSSDGPDAAAAQESGPAVPTYATDAPVPAPSSTTADGGQDAGAEPAGPGDVVVTYQSWDAATAVVEVGGYVDGLSEDGGTCTLELTRDGEQVSGESTGLGDASTTSCGTLQVTLPGGDVADWTAVLAYRSDTGTSTSEPFTVTER